MAFGSSSAMFTEWPRSVMGHGQTAAVLPAGYAGLGADTIKAALFNNSVTPDKDAALTSTGYNSGTWTSGNAVNDSDGSDDWPAAGIALSSKVLSDQGSGVFRFDAADTTHSNTVTITNAFGCLVYDDTITAGTGGCADQGISYHSFGGAQSVTTGTFTVVWHANGLFQVSV
ncbi:hypothetical protein [Streptomyces sp. S1]|uniref:hypothetical protein n=1 Tax=Streptomyces sp. S1 TaxID=718288 RepID=UPI003D737443